MSWNCTAYFSDTRALLLTERVIVLCVYAAHACSFNYWSDYSQASIVQFHPWAGLELDKHFMFVSYYICLSHSDSINLFFLKVKQKLLSLQMFFGRVLFKHHAAWSGHSMTWVYKTSRAILCVLMLCVIVRKTFTGGGIPVVRPCLFSSFKRRDFISWWSKFPPSCLRWTIWPMTKGRPWLFLQILSHWHLI